MWELDHKKGWTPKNWCFQSVVVEKTLESPLDCKEIQPVHPKENQPWLFIHEPDNHDSVITHLDPDSLKCEVKWTLGSITMNKASGGDGIPVELSNPKRWCCESAALNMSANLENLAVATGLKKVSFHSNPKERQCQRMFKLLHNCTHLTC